MSWIKLVDNRTENRIDIDKITTLKGEHQPKNLNFKNEYATEIKIDAKNKNVLLGTIYKISHIEDIFKISREISFETEYPKQKSNFEKESAKKVDDKIKKLTDEIQKIIDNAKKDKKSITIDLSEEKYLLPDCLK